MPVRVLPIRRSAAGIACAAGVVMAALAASPAGGQSRDALQQIPLRSSIDLSRNIDAFDPLSEGATPASLSQRDRIQEIAPEEAERRGASSAAPPRPQPRLEEPEAPASRWDGSTPAGSAALEPRRFEAPDGEASLRRTFPEPAAGQEASPPALREADRLGVPPGQVRPAIFGARAASPLQERAEPAFREAGDPFAAVGIRAGRFLLYPSLEQSLGYSDNIDESSVPESGVFSETELAARLFFDWSRHAAEIEAVGRYRRNFAGEEPVEPGARLDGRLLLDIDRLTALTLRGGLDYGSEDPIETTGLPPLSERSDVLLSFAGAALSREIGSLQLSGTGDVRRKSVMAHENGSFAALRPLDESYTTYGLGLRSGYRLSPALMPFLEGGLGWRVFDEAKDFEGIERASLIETLRSGVAFDFGEKLRGEAAVGYAWNAPEAEERRTIGAPTVDARIDWSPQRGTDVALIAATSFEPDSVNLAPATVYRAALGAAHRLTARAVLHGEVSMSFRRSDNVADRERLLAAETGFTYWLNRALAFTGLIRHERLSAEDEDHRVNSARIGLRLQR